jgi:hypothetical protein
MAQRKRTPAIDWRVLTVGAALLACAGIGYWKGQGFLIGVLGACAVLGVLGYVGRIRVRACDAALVRAHGIIGAEMRVPAVTLELRAHAWDYIGPFFDPIAPLPVRANYGPDFADDNPAARASVEKALSRKFGVPVAGDWDPPRDTVLFHRARGHVGTLTPPPAGDELAAPDPQHARIVQTLHAALREFVGPKGDLFVTVVGSDNDGAPDRLRVAYPAGFKDHIDDKRAEFLDIANSKLDGRWAAVSWNTRDNVVDLSRRPDMPTFIPHPGFAPGRPWHRLSLGPDGHGKERGLDVTIVPHTLVTGTTLSGKTATMRALACAVTAGRAEATLVDPKRVEFQGFRNWPGVRVVASNPSDMIEAIDGVWKEMDRRYREFDNRQVPLSSHTPWFLIVDEFEELVSLLNGMHYGKGTTHPTIRNAHSIARLGRLALVYLVVGTQRADADWFKGAFRDNLQNRIGVGPLGRDAARMAFDDSSVGRDVPANTKGRENVLNGESRDAFEVQNYWVPRPGDEDNTASDIAILDRLRAAAAAAHPGWGGKPDIVELDPEPELEPAEVREKLSPPPRPVLREPRRALTVVPGSGGDEDEDDDDDPDAAGILGSVRAAELAPQDRIILGDDGRERVIDHIRTADDPDFVVITWHRPRLRREPPVTVAAEKMFLRAP